MKQLKNIVILGTSNSILVNGWVHGLKSALPEGVTVHNLSTGASCSGLHIANILLHLDLLKTADLIFVDAAINGLNHINAGLTSQQLELDNLHGLYDLLFDLNVPVIGLIFPHYHFVRIAGKNPVLKKHIRIIESYGFMVLNFYSCTSRFENYKPLFYDHSHLFLSLAFRIGEAIGSFLAKNELLAPDRPSSPTRSSYEYSILDFARRAEELSLSTLDISTSVVSMKVAVIDKDVVVDDIDGREFVGCLHWNRTKLSKLKISHNTGEYILGLRGKFAAFESTLHSVPLGDLVTFGPASEEAPVTHRTILNHYKELTYGVPQVSAVLLRKPRASLEGAVTMARPSSARMKLKLFHLFSRKPKVTTGWAASKKKLMDRALRIFKSFHKDCEIASTKVNSFLSASKPPTSVLADVARYFRYQNIQLATFLLERAIAESDGAQKKRLLKLLNDYKNDAPEEDD